MHTPPVDLPESLLRDALEGGWALRAAVLRYRAVGFGSHHWEAEDAGGGRWFVTVDDLRTRRVSGGEPLGAGYNRLRAALAAAGVLRAAGRDFVVAPRKGRDGEPLARLGDVFAVAVYPFVDGETRNAFTAEHRRAILDLLLAVHSGPSVARADDYTVPFRDAFDAGGARAAGPYARAAAELLAAHAPGLRRALARYDGLVAAARADPPGMVLTHGEPHPGNTMRTGDGWRLIDWDTALLAPPERDLWDLDPGDGTLHAAYAAATGTVLRPGLLELYRRRWDLAEIAAGLARFREPHGGDADDDEETWAILADLVTRV